MENIYKKCSKCGCIGEMQLVGVEKDSEHRHDGINYGKIGLFECPTCEHLNKVVIDSDEY